MTTLIPKAKLRRIPVDNGNSCIFLYGFKQMKIDEKEYTGLLANFDETKTPTMSYMLLYTTFERSSNKSGPQSQECRHRSQIAIVFFGDNSQSSHKFSNRQWIQ